MLACHGINTADNVAQEIGMRNVGGVSLTFLAVSPVISLTRRFILVADGFRLQFAVLDFGT